MLSPTVQIRARYSDFRTPPHLSSQRFLTAFVTMTHTMGRPMDSRPPDDVNPTGGLFMSLHKSQDARPMELSTRVSSQVLSLASPVFAAILSSNCAEGQAPRNATSQYSPSIALHEDSPGVMIWLCEVLQFKQDLTFDIYFSLLIESATLCDKYDLVSVLYPWSRRWLRDGPGPLHGVESHAEMHWISYGQGNEEHFWRASRSLMQSCTMEDLAALKNKPWPVIVPDVVLGRYPFSPICIQRHPLEPSTNKASVQTA